MPGIKIVQGGGDFWIKEKWPAEKVKIYLDALAAAHIREIDTAQNYGDSESVLGINKASEFFDISTKIPGIMSPGSFRREEMVARTLQSLEKLQTKQIDILYLHSPDPSIPIEETLAGIQDLYVAGIFRRFGISNYTTKEVRKIHHHQKKNGWVLPRVYQGNFNPVARVYEEDLLPTLRELGIAFYAYSPAAGGFLAKSKQQVLDGTGRFSQDAGSIGTLYRLLYSRPPLLDALSEWSQIAKNAGCSPYTLAIRWVTFNSPLKPEYGDALIVGIGTIERLQEVLGGLKQGPLPQEITERINGLWNLIKDDAPVDNITAIYN